MQLARPVIFALLLCARVLSAAADDYLQQIRRVELDPERCYRVRDVFLEREEIKLYFTDGHLIFGRKVHGRDIAVAFVSSEPADTGEALLIPPTPGERHAIARFLDETVLDEKFRTAVFFFTDDTADVLMRAIDKSPSSRADAAAGARLAPRWSTIVRNLLGGAAPARVRRCLLRCAPRRRLLRGRHAREPAGALRGLDRTPPRQAGQRGQARPRPRPGILRSLDQLRGKKFSGRPAQRHARAGAAAKLPDCRRNRPRARHGRAHERRLLSASPAGAVLSTSSFPGACAFPQCCSTGEAVEFLQKEQPAFSGPSRRPKQSRGRCAARAAASRFAARVGIPLFRKIDLGHGVGSLLRGRPRHVVSAGRISVFRATISISAIPRIWSWSPPERRSRIPWTPACVRLVSERRAPFVSPASISAATSRRRGRRTVTKSRSTATSPPRRSRPPNR